MPTPSKTQPSNSLLLIPYGGAMSRSQVDALNANFARCQVVDSGDEQDGTDGLNLDDVLDLFDLVSVERAPVVCDENGITSNPVDVLILRK